MDEVDRSILAVLEKDGRISNAELAARVGLSPSPCLRRVRRLEETGVIRGYRALIDPVAVGRGLRVFAGVRLVVFVGPLTTTGNLCDGLECRREGEASPSRRTCSALGRDGTRIVGRGSTRFTVRLFERLAPSPRNWTQRRTVSLDLSNHRLGWSIP